MNPVPGANFYRIKSYDQAGQNKYSAIVKVVIGKDGAGFFSIYPNPVEGNIISLQVNNQPVGVYQLRLINNLGQVLYQNSMQNDGGSNVFTIKTATKLTHGIYQLEILGPDNNTDTQKIIVE